MLAFVAPPLAPYTPPLRLPPLRGPVISPYRPPVTNRPPGTQPAPIYQPPDLLPPTELDLKGEVCIFANTPIWEPKKIRYRYPGENWQEIAGESYYFIKEFQSPNLPITDTGLYEIINPIAVYRRTNPITGFVRENARYILDIPHLLIRGPLNLIWVSGDHGGNKQIVLFGQKKPGEQTEIYYLITAEPQDFFPNKPAGNTHTFKSFTYNLALIQEDPDNPPPIKKCTFKVFNIFDQEILSITRDECPEVAVIPERCYFKPENERLIAKVFQSFLDPPLRIEYQGNCATVWKDAWPINYFPLMIYKECTDNPNCPPPRIRLDNKKCKEECQQCPIGTAVKVLLRGGNIACVDVFGCIIKEIKFKPGCNSYDCICG